MYIHTQLERLVPRALELRWRLGYRAAVGTILPLKHLILMDLPPQQPALEGLGQIVPHKDAPWSTTNTKLN